VGDSDAVMYGHPISKILLFLLLFLAHGLGEFSRRILGEPPELAIVRRRGVAESESVESSRPRSHFE
jgi:hypothetical protein